MIVAQRRMKRVHKLAMCQSTLFCVLVLFVPLNETLAGSPAGGEREGGRDWPRSFRAPGAV